MALYSTISIQSGTYRPNEKESESPILGCTCACVCVGLSLYLKLHLGNMFYLSACPVISPSQSAGKSFLKKEMMSVVVELENNDSPSFSHCTRQSISSLGSVTMWRFTIDLCRFYESKEKKFPRSNIWEKKEKRNWAMRFRLAGELEEEEHALLSRHLFSLLSLTCHKISNNSRYCPVKQ